MWLHVATTTAFDRSPPVGARRRRDEALAVATTTAFDRSPAVGVPRRRDEALADGRARPASAARCPPARCRARPTRRPASSALERREGHPGDPGRGRLNFLCAVIDEVKLGPLSMARLIHIPLDSLKGTIVGIWPRLKRFDKTFLSVTEDGGLLLAVSGGPGAKGKSWFTKLRVEPHSIELVWARQEKGRLEAVPVESAVGMTARYDDGVGRFISAGDLAPRGRRSHELGDCF